MDDDRLTSGARTSRSDGSLSFPERTHTARHVLRAENPQVVLTWGSRLPAKPDKLKLRKRVSVPPLPIRFNLKADYDTETREFSYGVTCKDTLLGGRFSVNMPQSCIEYKKRFACPNGMTLALNGSARIEGRSVRPALWMGLEFGSSSDRGASRASLVHGPDGDSWDVRQRFRIFKGLKLEVNGSVRVPTPSARYSAGAGGTPGSLVLGEGYFHLHVAEVNAIVQI